MSATERTAAQGSGYALWVGPGEDTNEYATIRRCVDEIAAAYQAPSFVPHVTLLSEIRTDLTAAREGARRLATELRTFDIWLEGTGSDEVYFRALYARAIQTRDLMDANGLARRIYGLEKPPYAPHASLAYGAFSPETISRIKDSFAERIAAASRVRFAVRHLDLWDCRGPAEDWTLVERFPL